MNNSLAHAHLLLFSQMNSRIEKYLRYLTFHMS